MSSDSSVVTRSGWRVGSVGVLKSERIRSQDDYLRSTVTPFASVSDREMERCLTPPSHRWVRLLQRPPSTFSAEDALSLSPMWNIVITQED